MSSSSNGKRKHVDSRDGTGEKRGKKAKSLQQHAQVRGPGIFVSCVRGKERKAAHELIEFLEDIADQIYAGVQIEDADGAVDEQSMDALRNGAATTITKAKTAEQQLDGGKDDIEAQIKAELADIKGGAGTQSQSREKQVPRFKPVMTDMECFFFVSVARPLDPVKITYALLDKVKRTGQARSRFVHRLSPVCDTVHADIDKVTAEADRVIAQYFASASAPPHTFKVEVKMRLHAQLSKMDIVHALAKRMPATCTAKLSEPDAVLSVEVFRMTCGVSLLPHYDAYRKLNPLMVAEQWHANSDPSKKTEASSCVPAR